MGCDRKNRRNDAGTYVPDATAEGEPIYTVSAALAGEADPTTGMAGRPDIVRVNIAGDDPALVFGQAITFEDFVIRTGTSRDGNAYAMFSASGVAAATPSPAAANGQAPASGARAAGPAPAASAGSNTPGRS